MISQIGFLPRKCPLLFTEFKSLIPTSRHIKCMSPFALGQKGNGVWLKTRTEGLIWTNGGLYTRLRKKEGGKTCTVWGIIPWHTNLFFPIPLRKVPRMEATEKKSELWGPQRAAFPSHLDPGTPWTSYATGVPVDTSSCSPAASILFFLCQLKSGLYNLQTKSSEKYWHISKQ